MIMLKLDRTGIETAGWRRGDRLIQKGVFPIACTRSCEIGSAVGYAENAGIKVDHVNLIDRGKEALGQRVVL